MNTNHAFKGSVRFLRHRLQEAAGYGTAEGEVSLTQTWLMEPLLSPGEETSDKRRADYHEYITAHIQH